MRLLPILMGLLFPGIAVAHNLHQSTSTVTVAGKTLAWVIIAPSAVAPPTPKSRLNRRVIVENNGATCPMENAQMAPSPKEAGHTLISLKFECAAPITRLTLYYNLFFGQRDHVHTAEVTLGKTVRTVSFTPMTTSATVTAP